MAQTSVEWLKLKTKQIDFFVETKQITWKEYHKTKDNLYEQAKEMHKEEIEEAYNHRNITTLLGRLLTSENYYNETFNK